MKLVKHPPAPVTTVGAGAPAEAFVLLPRDCRRETDTQVILIQLVLAYHRF